MHSVLIHDYYAKREPPPVYLTLDGKLKSGKLDIKAFIRYYTCTCIIQGTEYRVTCTCTCVVLNVLTACVLASSVADSYSIFSFFFPSNCMSNQHLYPSSFLFPCTTCTYTFIHLYFSSLSFVFLVVSRCKVGVPDKTQGVMFSPVPLEFSFFDPERIGVQLLRNNTDSEGGVVNIRSGLNTIESVLSEMETTLDRLLNYTKSILVSSDV